MTSGPDQQTARVNIDDDAWRQFRILAIESDPDNARSRSYTGRAEMGAGSTGRRNGRGELLCGSWSQGSRWATPRGTGVAEADGRRQPEPSLPHEPHAPAHPEQPGAQDTQHGAHGGGDG